MAKISNETKLFIALLRERMGRKRESAKERTANQPLSGMASGELRAYNEVEALIAALVHEIEGK